MDLLIDGSSRWPRHRLKSQCLVFGRSGHTLVLLFSGPVTPAENREGPPYGGSIFAVFRRFLGAARSGHTPCLLGVISGTNLRYTSLPMAAADGSTSGLELQLTLLHAALSGGRCATLTEPFPPTFDADSGDSRAGVDEDDAHILGADWGRTGGGLGGRDYDALRSTVASLPPLAALTDPAGEGRRGLGGQQRQLLEWLEVTLSKVRPVALERSILDLTDSSAGAAAAMAAPSHQFSVRATLDAPRQQRWDAAASEHGTRVVYHGSAVENFHSIINNGLKNYSGTERQTTGAVFGNGIYLSNSLALVQNFAPVQSASSRVWGGASFGGAISAVAICEVLLHPQVRRPGVRGANFYRFLHFRWFNLVFVSFHWFSTLKTEDLQCQDRTPCLRSKPELQYKCQLFF